MCVRNNSTFFEAIEMEEEKDAVTRCLEIIQQGTIVYDIFSLLRLSHDRGMRSGQRL